MTHAAVSPGGGLTHGVGFLTDIATISRRAVRSVVREPEYMIPALIIPVFFFVVNTGALESFVEGQAPSGSNVGLDYRAFQLPVAIIFAVTGISRASVLVIDIRSGYLDRMLVTPIRRSTLLFGLMVADIVMALGLALFVVVMGLAFGVWFETGVLGLLVFLLLAIAWSVAYSGIPYTVALRRQGRDGAGSGAGSRGGYASVSQEMWKAAGEDYLAGDTAETVGARYGMGVSTFRARARKAGWLRRDQPDPDPIDGPLDAADLLDEPADFAVMADQALARLNRAVQSGRAMEAARWMRLHLSLAALARQQDAAPPPPKPEPPDRIDRAAAVAREIGVIAREAAALTRGDIPGRDALMARVDALDDLSPPPISDELHYSDGVFAEGGSETGPPAPQIVIPEPSEAKTPEPRTAPPP